MLFGLSSKKLTFLITTQETEHHNVNENIHAFPHFTKFNNNIKNHSRAQESILVEDLIQRKFLREKIGSKI